MSSGLVSVKEMVVVASPIWCITYATRSKQSCVTQISPYRNREQAEVSSSCLMRKHKQYKDGNDQFLRVGVSSLVVFITCSQPVKVHLFGRTSKQRRAVHLRLQPFSTRNSLSPSPYKVLISTRSQHHGESAGHASRHGEYRPSRHDHNDDSDGNDCRCSTVRHPRAARTSPHRARSRHAPTWS